MNIIHPHNLKEALAIIKKKILGGVYKCNVHSYTLLNLKYEELHRSHIILRSTYSNSKISVDINFKSYLLPALHDKSNKPEYHRKDHKTM